MRYRDLSIDNISGLLIIYMVLVHICQWCGLNYLFNNMLFRLFSFFMFWFFYKSGMYYREKTNKEILMGGGKKLMLPFIIFSIIGHSLNCLQLYVSGDYNWIHYLLSPIKQFIMSGSSSGNLPLWFLPSLLFVQYFYAVLSKIMRDELILIIGLTIAYILFRLHLHVPLYLSNVSLGLAIYSFGHIMRVTQYNHRVYYISLVVFFILLFQSSSTIDFRVNEVRHGNYFLAILFSLLGCISINNVFKFGILQNYLFQWVGFRSMKIYVTHWLILTLCSIIFPYQRWNMFVVMILSCVILIPLVDKLWNIITKLNSFVKQKYQ